MNELNRLSISAQRTFAAEFPRSQVITKTDAAKYVVTWDRQPHQVSAGAQKNFKAFAGLVADEYSERPELFDEKYYRRLVGKAILFNSVRSAISHSDWYESGYLANLAAYAVAKLSYEIAKDPRAETFDLLQIWQAQAVGQATLTEAVEMARLALAVLTGKDRMVVNVTEWAKKENAWKMLASVPYTLSHDFISECIPVKKNAVGEVAVTVSARFPTDVSELEHVEGIDAKTWTAIRTFLAGKGSLTALENRLLQKVTASSRLVLDVEVARGLLRLYVKALNEGWREGGRK